MIYIDHGLCSTTAMTLSCLDHIKRNTDGQALVKRPPAPPQAVLFTFAVDRSGSMRSYGSAVVEQTNKLIGEQKAFSVDRGIPTFMTLTTFDDVTDDRMSKANLNNIEIPTLLELSDWLSPRNCTRLLDTAIESLNKLIDFRRKYVRKFSREIRGLITNDSIRMIFALFTDGFDNASDWTSGDLRRKMKEFDKHGGVAMFMAANQDAIYTGGRFGFSEARSLSVGVTKRTATSALGCTSGLLKSASAGERDVSYTPTMRESSQECSYVTPNYIPDNDSDSEDDSEDDTHNMINSIPPTRV